jgi:translation initiation factor 1A
VRVVPKKRREEGEKSDTFPLPNDEEGTMICVVQQNIGGGFLQVLCTDEQVYKARIPGKMRRRVWMKEGDVVLFLPWGTRDMKGEIVYKYSKDQVKKLIEMGLLPEEMLEEVTE